jgi:hypothetical protein
MKIKKYISIEFFIVLIYIIFNFIQALILINTRTFWGDFFPLEVELSNKIIWLLFLYK